MRLKKMTAVILSGLMLLPLTACGSASQTGSDAASSVEPEIVLDVHLRITAVNRSVQDGREHRRS